jgi:hypothetical protein
MQTAVIFAEERAADHVCKNVNKGFYSLIRSQISQKMAKLQSEVDAHLMQLLQQKNALLSIKTRMQRDYNMISSRYIKLFNGLNSNLKQRVFELDKPTVDFAVRELDKISNRTKYLTATIPVTQLESLISSQKIVASNVKHRGLNVIKSMRSFLFEMNAQKKLTDQILINDGRHSETATIFIPLLMFESIRDKEESIFEIIVSNVLLDKMTRDSIRNTVFDEMNQFKWKDQDNISSEIISEYRKLVISSSYSKRVKDMTNHLFQSNKYQTT